MEIEKKVNENKVRGFVDDDDKAFGLAAIPKLKAAQEELHFLLNRSYPKKSASAFVGNHHQLTVRQSLALARATASAEHIALRKMKLQGIPSFWTYAKVGSICLRIFWRSLACLNI